MLELVLGAAKQTITENFSYEAERIFIANQNNLVLPKDKIFCMILPATQEEIMWPLDDGLEIRGLANLTLTVDFYGAGAAAGASKASVFFNSGLGIGKSKEKGLQVLYCSYPQNLTGIDYTDLYLERWQVQLNVNFETNVKFDDPTAETIVVETNQYQ